MYARSVKGQTLHFAVSGLLWEMSLVMIDRETRSLWSHLLGEAMRGPLQGEQLATVPSIMTDWQTWRTRYPGTTAAVMPRTTQDYRRDLHLEGSGFVIGLAGNGQSRAWRFTELRLHRVVNDRFAGQAVVVIFDDTSGTAVIHGRTVDDRELTFRWNEGRLIDRETGSEWDPITATALSGPMKGKELLRQDGVVSLDQAWMIFHPESTLWQPPPSPREEPPTT